MSVLGPAWVGPPTQKVGFTGSREGCTDAQFHKLEDVITLIRAENNGIAQAHHGICQGSDVNFHTLMRELRYVLGVPRIIGHPSDHALRAPIPDEQFDELREIKPPLVRNEDIVNETNVLIATPFTAAERIRSGTWFTVRYARSLDRPIFIIYPDGSLRREN